MLKIFGKMLTDILCYFSAPGWVIALIFGDYEKSKVHLNQAMAIGLLNLLSEFAYIFAQMFFTGKLFGVAKLIYDMLHLFFLALSLIGIFRAMRGNDTPMPVVGYIRFLK